MMATRPHSWLALSDSQVRVYTDARQYFEAYEASRKALEAYRGWLFFKRYPNGTEYLYRATDRSGRGTTMGRRTAETERLAAAFKSEQAEAKRTYKIRKDALVQHARFCKAARLNRLPRHAAALIRAFANHAAHLNFVIVGTHALYAYEAMAYVQFLSSVMETQHLDVLWDTRANLAATVTGAGDATVPRLLDVLREVDPTYTRNEEKTSQARNAAAFAVDFLAPRDAPLDPQDRIHPLSMAAVGVLSQAIRAEVVIDQDGMPLTMHVPDPRVFAAHKLWVAGRADRPPGKRDRDRAQSMTLVDALKERTPVLDALPELEGGEEVAQIERILTDLDLE